jgi:hypothetical protein
MKKIFSLLFFTLLIVAVSAQTTVKNQLAIDFAWYPSNLEGYRETGFVPVDFSSISASELAHLDGGRDLGGNGYEAQVKAVRSYTLPWLRGAGPLTSGNNVEVQLRGEFSPVSINTVVRTILTPLAFLNIDAAVFLGTGWTAAGLNGLALNTEADPFEPIPLEGLVLGTSFGLTGQFDFGVLVPGDWTHVAVVYRAGLDYRLNTAAGEAVPWQWLADAGENFNGWTWNQTALLAYQTPALKLVDAFGVLLETNQNITQFHESPMNEGGWGSDFMEVFLGPIVVLKWGGSHSLNIQFQFATERDYTDESVGNEHFFYRRVDTANPTYWYFRRAAFSYTFVCSQ